MGRKLWVTTPEGLSLRLAVRSSSSGGESEKGIAGWKGGQWLHALTGTRTYSFKGIDQNEN